MTHKQAIIVRKDLKMRRGKEIAQGAHASLGAILGQMTINDTKMVLDLTDERLNDWLAGNFKKITLVAESESDLLDLKRQADELGLISCLIQDAGLTEFGGVPTYTTLAIGPDLDENVDKVTKNLKLY